jgi:putative methylase
MRSKRQLAVLLSKLKQIISVDRGLEQYQTDSEMAADIIWNAYMMGDIGFAGEHIVADLGCGNGALGIGAMMMGANRIVFVDKDKKAIEILKENLECIEDIGGFEALIVPNDIDNINLCFLNEEKDEKAKKINEGYLKDKEEKNEDIWGGDKEYERSIIDKEIDSSRKVVVMNPPFGTKTKHADRVFLEKAFDFADSIYSVHKAESMEFLKSISREKGFKIDRVWEYDFGIKNCHEKHKKRIHKFKVVCVRLVKG